MSGSICVTRKCTRRRSSPKPGQPCRSSKRWMPAGSRNAPTWTGPWRCCLQGLREEALKRLQTLTPKPPETHGLTPLAPGEEVQGTHFVVSLDPATGSIRRLQDRKTGREWASAQHLLASFRYQTFTKADFDRFNHAYNTEPMGYDFSKPGLEKYPVQSRTWQPTAARNVGRRRRAGASDRGGVALAQGRCRIGGPG